MMKNHHGERGKTGGEARLMVRRYPFFLAEGRSVRTKGTLAIAHASHMPTRHPKLIRPKNSRISASVEPKMGFPKGIIPFGRRRLFLFSPSLPLWPPEACSTLRQFQKEFALTW